VAGRVGAPFVAARDAAPFVEDPADPLPLPLPFVLDPVRRVTGLAPGVFSFSTGAGVSVRTGF
jgi:hypothetical protein